MVAAVIILVSVGAGVFALKDNILYRSMSTAYGETRSVVLPDGSLVSMNAHSAIRYSRWGFGDKEREVYLSGEADFSVIHTKSGCPFLVRTDNNLDIVVLGTRFTVYTRGGQARVVLKQGKVELDFREQHEVKKLVLLPGDLFTLHAGQRNKLERVSHPDNLSAWKNHEFLFDGTSLSEFAVMIKDDFGLTMHFEDPALGERRISGNFHADTAGELLDVISQLLDIHYKTKEDKIYFSE
jgi:ferric-dicitrate binding protein FerR (iron transport regulator)